MPDSYIESFRVGATNSIAAKYLARRDASVYGLLGSGQMAWAQLRGMAKVRRLSLVKVFSPTRENREAFAQKWRGELDLNVQAVESVEEAVTGSDIVGIATNSMVPVVTDPSLLKEGAFITSINAFDLDQKVFEACEIRSFFANKITWPEDRTKNWFTPLDARMQWTQWVSEDMKDTYPLHKKLHHHWANDPTIVEACPWIGDLIAGRVKRENDSERACFINNIGLGLQFAAVGVKAYEAARAQGLGRDLPIDWFTQETHG
jgi:ornithine cyclodeaminase/alanine dehydrogenase-like protein (mu-crystallin family)